MIESDQEAMAVLWQEVEKDNQDLAARLEETLRWVAERDERIAVLEDENKVLWAWWGEAFKLFYEMHTTRSTNLTDIAFVVHTAPPQAQQP